MDPPPTLSKRLMPQRLPTSGQLWGHQFLGHPRNTPAFQRVHDKCCGVFLWEGRRGLRAQTGHRTDSRVAPRRGGRPRGSPSSHPDQSCGLLFGAGRNWFCMVLLWLMWESEQKNSVGKAAVGDHMATPSGCLANLFPIRGLGGSRLPICL